MGAEDKARARQLRAEARRRRRDEALRRYQERTERRAQERDVVAEAQRAAAERLERERAAARAQLDAERQAAEEAERQEAAERERAAEEAAERQRIEREEAERAAKRQAAAAEPVESAPPVELAEPTEAEERQERQVEPQTEGLISESRAEPVVEDSMTAHLPSAPRDVGSPASAVPEPPSPRRSLAVRIVRALGSLAVAVGSVASIVLALGALTLALGEKPAGLFAAIEPVCRVLALGTGAEMSALDVLVTWIIAAVAYLIVGFALQAVSRQLTRPRR